MIHPNWVAEFITTSSAATSPNNFKRGSQQVLICRGFLTAAVAVTAVLFLSGCTPDLSEYSQVTAKLDRDSGAISYPLSNYALTGADATTVEHANALLIQDCMATSGLDFLRASQDWKDKADQSDRTFGLWSPTVAARDGYDIPSESAKRELEGWEAEQPESWWTEYWECLDTSKQLPSMSLLVGNPTQPSSVDRGYTEALRSTQSSAIFKEARSDWIQCIANEGLTAQDGAVLVPVLPDGAESRFDVALRDVKCKEDLGTMQLVADVMARYQAAYIDAHEGDLNTYREDAQGVLAEAREIVATYGG